MQSVASTASTEVQTDSVKFSNDQEVRLRFTALAGMDKFPGLLDYAAADRVELLRDYYRPRVEAWLNHMQERIREGKIDYGQLLNGPYKEIARSFVAGHGQTPVLIPSGKQAADVAAHFWKK